ncbi:hypothetical protein BD779DRAFT_1472855 [Infundibulicybe gibba]|nr:hypothetical protein BD779DRAFT_1472855 [Infundibulicybe gibba]
MEHRYRYLPMTSGTPGGPVRWMQHVSGGLSAQLRDVNAYTSLSMTYMSAGSITPEGKVWAHVPADIGECWDDTCAWVWLPNMIVSVKESIITYHVQPVVLESVATSSALSGIATGWRMMAAAVLIRRARGKLGCSTSPVVAHLATLPVVAAPLARTVSNSHQPRGETSAMSVHNLIAPSRSPPQREFNHSDYLRFHVAWLSASQSYRFPCHRRPTYVHVVCLVLASRADSNFLMANRPSFEAYQDYV